ncbi:helix-turn-helix transcriptional regulator [Clostridium akagii]|uniref:helix-turn-helix transcriptional regulator n=1 Tax=Clostridium akagii TaxID=91623 RepID=UPI00047D45B4|nr:YafY family protein [Clostridium akagii]
MQINRLFEIVYILLDKQIVTAKELARHFEVSSRTIYRDVDTLSSAGIPIYATQGKNGGITLLDNFVLNKSVLSEDEQNEILIALQSLTATGYPIIDITLSKLSSFFKKENYNWIEVDFSSWGSNEHVKEKFEILKNAIINNKIITFEYYNSKGEKTNRKIEPIKLRFKAKSWYLKGFCLTKNEDRTFKITRMFDVKLTEELYTKKHLDEELIEPEKNEVDNLINLKLRFSSSVAYRIYDEFDKEAIIKNKDGSFNVDASLPRGVWIYDYILSFGTTIEVLEPIKVREVIKSKLEDIINKYK